MERNLNYSTYLYIIYALVFLATHYTGVYFGWERVSRKIDGRVGRRGGGEGNDAQFKLSWIILAISDLYGSENATVFPQPITTRFPPPDNGLFNAPPIYHSAKFYKRLSNLVALGFRSIASIFPTNNFNLIIVYWSSFNGKFARFIHLIIIGIATHKFKWDCYYQLVIYIKVSNSRFISHTFRF